MFTSSSLRLSGAVLALSCLLGCGHDENGPIYSSGVDKTKRGTTLSDDDKNEFCSSLDQHLDVVVGFQELAQIACFPAALLSISRADCQQKLDACVANAPSPISATVRQTREQRCYDSLSACDADVGTLEGCVNLNVGAVRAVLNALTCGRFGDTSAIQEANSVMDTARTCANTSNDCGEATTILL